MTQLASDDISVPSITSFAPPNGAVSRLNDQNFGCAATLTSHVGVHAHWLIHILEERCISENLGRSAKIRLHGEIGIASLTAAHSHQVRGREPAMSLHDDPYIVCVLHASSCASDTRPS